MIFNLTNEILNAHYEYYVCLAFSIILLSVLNVVPIFHVLISNFSRGIQQHHFQSKSATIILSKDTILTSATPRVVFI